MKTLEQIESIEKEVKCLSYHELLKKYELVGQCGKEDYRHYFFAYDNETIIEFHDRSDSTVTNMSVDELVEFYS